LNFVRRATKLFLSFGDKSSDVASELVPRSSLSEQLTESLPRPTLTDLGRDGFAMDGDSQGSRLQTVDLSDISTSCGKDSQVVSPVVGTIPIDVSDHESSKIRDPPPKKKHMKSNPQSSRRPTRKRRVRGGVDHES
jgi:hypothetical protein